VSRRPPARGADERVDLGGVRGIELSGRLVGDESRGRCASAAQIATRCCCRPTARRQRRAAVEQADALEQPVRGAHAPLARRAEQREPQRDLP
jgi:hypothetical protein